MSAGRPQAVDAAELHAQRGQHLPDVVVQLARQVLAFLFLRRHELLRELAHQVLGLFGHVALVLRAPLEHAQADDRRERDDETEEEAAPEEPVQLGAERFLPPGDLGALAGVVGVVQFFDLAAMASTASRRGSTSRRRKPALWLIFSTSVQSKSGSKACQYSSSFASQAGDALFVARSASRERAEIGDRREVVLAELGQLLAIERRPLALGVEEVVADEDAREVDVGPQAAQLGLDLALVRVELVELRVDFLGAIRRREHGDDDQQQQASKPERRDRPGSEAHGCLPSYSFGAGAGIPLKPEP